MLVSSRGVDVLTPVLCDTDSFICFPTLFSGFEHGTRALHHPDWQHLVVKAVGVGRLCWMLRSCKSDF